MEWDFQGHASFLITIAGIRTGKISMTFRQVPIGARFKFLGVVYTKTAHSMAQDKNLIDWIFGHNEWQNKKSGQRVVELLPDSQVENPSQPAFTA